MEEMTIRASLIAVALLAASIPAALAQTTNEVALSMPEYGRAPGDQLAPVVATDGRDFLVAWIDWRAIPAVVYANRVTGEGRVLDGTGIRISLGPAGFNGRLIGAFYAGGAYTIIYSSQLSAHPSFQTVVARISVDGRLVDGPRTILNDQYVRAGATNGSQIVLVTGDAVVVLDERAEIVGRFALPAAPAYGFSIASNGSTFLVGTFAYDGANSVNLIALDANGKPADVTRIAASGSGDGPVIGSDGSDYLVLYIDARTFKPVAQSVDPHARIRSTTIIDGVPDSIARGAIVWTGRFYLAAATSTDPEQQMEVFRLDRTGNAIAPARPLGNGTRGMVNQAAIVWNGTDGLVTWTTGSQLDPNGLKVVVALTTADAAPVSGVITIPSSSNMQVTPVIATAGFQDLAVWAEPGGIYATRVTPDGKALDGRGILVWSGTFPTRSLDGNSALRAVFDGGSYLVAWIEATGVTARRIDPSTGALVGSSMALAPCSRSFDLAVDEKSPLLFNADCSDGRVYAQRIGATTPVGAAVAISPPDMLANAPSAAWSGNEWLVVWHKLVPVPGLLISPPVDRAAAVYAARVSPALTLLDVQPILIAESDFNEGGPVVGTDGRQFLVVWSHTAYNSTDGLYLRRMQTDGLAGDAEPLVSGSFITAQSIAWSGARYTIGYSRNEGFWNDDLFLTHVSSRSDDPLIHDEVTISATDIDERFIALAASPGRPVRAVYTRVAKEPQYGGVSRVFMRDEADAARRRSVRQR